MSTNQIPLHAHRDAVLSMHHIQSLSTKLYVASTDYDTATALRDELDKWDRWGSPMDHDLADAIRAIMDRAAEQGDAYREYREDADATDEPAASATG